MVVPFTAKLGSKTAINVRLLGKQFRNIQYRNNRADAKVAKDKFTRDINRLLTSLRPSTSQEGMQQLDEIRDALVELRKRRLVKINHSVIELLCAHHLIEKGYHVAVEQLLEGGPLVADIYATRNNGNDHNKNDNQNNSNGSLVVEVETGFVPPEAALTPGRYRQARIAAKIARYSGHAQAFALATPNYHVLQVPKVLLRPPKDRTPEEIQQLKTLCDDYYDSPPILIDELAQTEVDAIYIINVDLERVVKIPPHKYLDTILRAEGLILS